jgi:hypothetical protein
MFLHNKMMTIMPRGANVTCDIRCCDAAKSSPEQEQLGDVGLTARPR